MSCVTGTSGDVIGATARPTGTDVTTDAISVLTTGAVTAVAPGVAIVTDALMMVVVMTGDVVMRDVTMPAVVAALGDVMRRATIDVTTVVVAAAVEDGVTVRHVMIVIAMVVAVAGVIVACHVTSDVTSQRQIAACRRAIFVATNRHCVTTDATIDVTTEDRETTAGHVTATVKNHWRVSCLLNLCCVVISKQFHIAD